MLNSGVDNCRYRSGTDVIGYHSDDERDLVRKAFVHMNKCSGKLPNTILPGGALQRGGYHAW